MRRGMRHHTDNGFGFGWEMVTATLWSVGIAVMLLGATYHRLGRPAVDWASPAPATVSLAGTGVPIR